MEGRERKEEGRKKEEMDERREESEGGEGYSFLTEKER